MKEEKQAGDKRRCASEKQKRRLLLVDEDEKDLDYYSGMLQYLGYDVEAVSLYSVAAVSLGRKQFDLVTVDQGSGDFEGRSVLARAVEVDRHLPVLVLARAVNVDCCVVALNSGAYEYAPKNLTATEMRELVDSNLYFAAGQDSADQDRQFQRDDSQNGRRVDQ